MQKIELVIRLIMLLVLICGFYMFIQEIKLYTKIRELEERDNERK